VALAAVSARSVPLLSPDRVDSDPCPMGVVSKLGIADNLCYKKMRKYGLDHLFGQA